MSVPNRDSAGPGGPAVPLAGPAPETPRRLVVVDDEPVILELFGTLFRDGPWEVVACPDGASAVAAMEQGGVDVLLTDKNLPDIGGLELIKRARAVTPDAEAIVVTGYASLDTALQAMQLEVFDYIVKPPKDIFEVRRKVGLAFERQRMRRENARLVEDLRVKNAELEARVKELRELQAELIQSEKLAGIGTLAAGVAHEISSPLFGIMGLAEAIVDEDDLGLVRRYAADIVEYSRGIKDIVVELSGYSRTAESEYLTTVDVARVIEDAVRLVVRSSGTPPDVVGLDLADGLYVNAKTSEIQQVFVNLVKNAVEAVGERWPGGGGRVVVSLREGEQGVVAVVTDNGPGIPEERLSAIFDPFYTTKPPGKGTGLGLNIVWRIASKYRGQVGVESRVGEGTSFTLRFPTRHALEDAWPQEPRG